MGNIQEVQSSVIKTLITDNNLKAALRRAKGPADIISWAIHNFTSKGDNYVGVVTSVRIKYKLDGKESDVSFIAKLGPPLPSEVLQEGINYAFFKEAKIYEEMIPLLNSQLTALGLRALRVPECYYLSTDACKEVVYLQDLRELGFKTPGRKVILDSAHSKLVLKELARLHAASLLLQAKPGYKKLGSIYPYIDEDFYDRTKEVRMVSADILNKSIQQTILFLRNYESHKKVIQWLEELIPNAFEKMMEDIDHTSKFAAICHCDCWNNNLLFRYDTEGNPVEVMIVDLQLLRRTSVVIDLKIFFYHAIDGPERRTNLKNYLDIYYATLKSVLEAGGLKVPFTREELDEEYWRRVTYPSFIAMTWLPPILDDSDDVLEGGGGETEKGSSGDGIPEGSGEKGKVVNAGITEDPSNTLTESEKTSFFRMFENNPQLTARFLDIFDLMVEGCHC